jgi:hypothetical protein
MFPTAPINTNTIALIAETPTVDLPSPKSLENWGLFGVIAYLCVQKGWEVFSKKESHEADLTTKLVEGLNANQAQMLANMTSFLDKTHGETRELKDAIVELKSAMVGLQGTIREELRAEFHDQSSAIGELKLSVCQLQKDMDRLNK